MPGRKEMIKGEMAYTVLYMFYLDKACNIELHNIIHNISGGHGNQENLQ